MKKILFPMLLFLTVMTIWSDTSVRPATEEEKAAVIKFKNLCTAVLPDGPDGWTETSRTHSRPPDHVPKGVENDMHSISYHINWVDRVNKKAGNEAAVQAVRKTMNASENPDQEMLMARQEELAEELGSAIQSGDMEKAAEIKKDLEKNGRKLQKVLSERNQAVSSAIEKNSVKDIYLKVRIRTNDIRQELPPGAQRREPIHGFQVWRLREGKMLRGEWREGTTLVLMGRWAPDEEKENVLLAEADKNLSHLCIQTMRIIVQAESSRARNYLEKIDWETLTAIMN